MNETSLVALTVCTYSDWLAVHDTTDFTAHLCLGVVAKLLLHCKSSECVETCSVLLSVHHHIHQ